jgi:hypothetical protein
LRTRYHHHSQVLLSRLGFPASLGASPKQNAHDAQALVLPDAATVAIPLATWSSFLDDWRVQLRLLAALGSAWHTGAPCVVAGLHLDAAGVAQVSGGDAGD